MRKSILRSKRFPPVIERLRQISPTYKKPIADLRYTNCDSDHENVSPCPSDEM